MVPLLGVLVCMGTGCALRTVPPIRFLPILGKEKTIETTDVLLRLLKDRDRAVRAGAVDLLGDLGQAGDKKLKKEVARVLGLAMKDRDPGLRVQVVQKLGCDGGHVRQQIPVQRPQGSSPVRPHRGSHRDRQPRAGDFCPYSRSASFGPTHPLSWPNSHSVNRPASEHRSSLTLPL